MRRLSNAVVISMVFMTFLLTATQSPKAYAVGSSGFENANLSARSRARGNASVADAHDASTIAFNPAGMTKLEGAQAYAGSSFVSVASKYKAFEGRSDEGNSETIITVPFLYTSFETPVDDVYLGIGMNSPFGLVSKWPSDGAFKYIAFFNEINTKAHHVSLAYRVGPTLSIGGGYSFIEMELKQVGKFNSSFLTKDAQDALFEYDVGGQGEGYNLGLLWDMSETETLGVFFRSEVRTHMKGTMNTDGLTGMIAGAFGGATNTTSADTDISLPANVTIGYKRQINEDLEMEFDMGWTSWSSYDSFDSVFGTSNNILAGFTRFDRDYVDTLSGHIGASYEVNPSNTFNCGYLFYQRAANKSNYSNENPDGDRHGISFGWQKKSNNLSFDITYLAMAIREVSITNSKGSTNGADIDGKYSGLIQVISTGLTYEF
jgi:long-chain fatty acid transport protein